MNQIDLLGWGYNQQSQLGHSPSTTTNLSSEFYNQTKLLDLEIRQLSLGESHTLILLSAQSGQLLGMGSNVFGQLGHKEQISFLRELQEIPINEPIVQIDCGSEHSLALAESGRVYVFGLNLKGQLGISNNQKNVFHPRFIDYLDPDSPSSSQLLKNEQVIQIRAGAVHSLILTNKKRVLSAGFNKQKQLGHSDQSPLIDQFQELKLLEDSLLKNIRVHSNQLNLRAGMQHSALFLEHKLFLWGTIVRQTVLERPQLHEFSFTIHDVQLGNLLTLVLLKNGDLFVMGENQFGQLGIKQNTTRKFVRLGISQITEVKCGSNHCIAYSKNNRRVYGWGCNQQKQIDIYSEEEQISQPQVLDFIKSISMVLD